LLVLAERVQVQAWQDGTLWKGFVSLKFLHRA
jgi:hypothetical protein